MQTPLWMWVSFNAAVFAILAIDLGIFNRHPRPIAVREALIWTGASVLFSMVCAGVVWSVKGEASGVEFLTGYVIEYALSVDNIFVFVILFTYFAVPAAFQHRVLFWGILTAIVLRGAMIGLGVTLIERFDWILYLFGAFLVYTGLRMLVRKGPEVNPEGNPLIRACRRVLPLTPEFEGARFMVLRDGNLLLTPLFLVFVVVNVTDVIFAVDSIPAIFGITLDPFVVYSSNICAVLGLRSLYFLLAGTLKLFTYLPTGLAVVLTFIGMKMLVANWWHIPTAGSLAFVALVLAVSVLASVMTRTGDR